MRFYYSKYIHSKYVNLLYFLFFVGVLYWQAAKYWNKIDILQEKLQQARIEVVFLAIGLHLLNHLLRAYRWQLLLYHQSIKIPFWHVFQAEMAGFFCNVFLPRSGEFTRSDNLRRRDHLPMSKALGSVGAERSLDLLFFVSFWLIASSLFFVFDYQGTKGNAVFSSFIYYLTSAEKNSPAAVTKSEDSSFAYFYAMLVVGLFCISAIIYYKYSSFWLKVWESLTISLRNTSYLIIFLTILIAFSYFCVEYACFYIMPFTEGVTFFSALFIFMIMTIAVAIPLPGNAAYMVLVAAAIQATGLVEDTEEGTWQAISYAVITHAIQLFNAVVVGGVLFVWSGYRISRRKDTMPTKMHLESA